MDFNAMRNSLFPRAIPRLSPQNQLCSPSVDVI
jgi:hypothetical protein